MDQRLIDIGLIVVNLLLGFFLRVIWESVTALQHADQKLADKVAHVENLVAGQYLLRTEYFESLRSMQDGHKSDMTALFMKLDRIEDKIDLKADKK